jgi:alpha-tubulin suppressor-like RCC1 family protein
MLSTYILKIQNASRAAILALIATWAGCAAGAPTPDTVAVVAPDAGPGCARDVDCHAEGPCRRATCREGHCAIDVTPPGAAAELGQTPGDCRRLVCDAHGDATASDDPADVPEAGTDPCVRPACDRGAPVSRPARAGTDCGRGGSCDGKGACLVIRDLTAGRHHSCAVLSDGSAQCWGANEAGQLGDGTLDTRPHAGPVVGVEKARAIAAGGGHSCALREDGTVVCWGHNDRGQLGDGGREGRPQPTLVRGVSGAVELAVGFEHACARLSGGEVKCWGANESGQLGVTGDDALLAVTVKGLVADEIGAGGAHTCARSGGVVRCWGKNDKGQLGDGTTRGRGRPEKVRGLDDAAQLGVGKFHTCARTKAGAVTCWGWNVDGQLGDGTEKDRSTPKAVSGLEGAIDVVAGNGHTCARMRSGPPQCWGWNQDGQLGDRGFATSPLPRTVVEVQQASRLALGSRHTCALDEKGGVTCWGRNDRGQLGNGPDGALR